MAASTVARSTLSKAIISQSFKHQTAIPRSRMVTPNGVPCRTFTLTSSIPPRRGMITQPLPMGIPEHEEEPVQRTLTPVHLEAMDVWRNEAKMLTDQMNIDDIPKGGKYPAEVNKVTQGQVKSLYAELIEDDLLDPRLCWSPTDDC